MATVENRLPPPPRRGHRSSGGQQCFRDGKAERLGGLEVDDGAQRACVFKGLPTQTVRGAKLGAISPRRSGGGRVVAGKGYLGGLAVGALIRGSPRMRY